MRKWLVPLIVFSAGGIGAYFLTGKRREALGDWLAEMFESPKDWQERNEGTLAELQGIQQALGQIAQSLDPHRQPGQP